MITHKQLIVSFIHLNYLISNGGTQKFLSELSDVFLEEGFSHLCFFPIIKTKSLRGKNLVGVIFNNRFAGIVLASEMDKTILYYLKKFHLKLNSLQIQHLRYFAIQDLLECLNQFQADIIVYLHDFYLICCTFNLVDSSGRFCGEDGFSHDKCKKCGFYEKECIHREIVNSFLHSIDNRIIRFIAPSLFVKKVFENSIPSTVGRISIRPHLILKGEKRVPLIDGKIRLAFLGRQVEHKGYLEWLKLIDKMKIQKNNAYEFYYLGIDHEKVDDVKNIFVSTVEQGPRAMMKSIADKNIACAFLWPRCPETYSYVYYELMNSGVFIITNTHSGNILCEVEKNKNGLCFTSLQEAANWFSFPDQVLQVINRYRSDASVPAEIITNSDICMCISNCYEEHLNKIENFKFRKVLSFLYKIKYGNKI